MSWLFPSSLRFRLTLLVALAILPALALIVHTAWEQRELALAQVQEDVARLARLAALDEEHLLDGTRQLLAAMSRLPEVRRGDRAECSALLSQLLAAFHRYANLGLALPNGEVICSGLPTQATVNIADREYFREALKSRDFAVGRYQVGRITGKPTMNLGYPVLDDSGEARFVLYAALDLAWLNRFELEVESQLPSGASLTKIDDKGRVVGRHPQRAEGAGGPALENSLVETVLSQRRGMTEATGLDGVRRFYAFRPLQRDGRQDHLFVVLGVPTAAVVAGVNRRLAYDLAFLGIVAVLAVAAAWLGGQVFILRRVDALLRAIDRLRSGDLASRTGLRHGRGELSRIARAFDEMAETLQQRQEERARLERDVLEIGDRERRRIGWDLHDGLGQQLTGIALKSKVLERELTSALPEAARQAAELCDLANAATEQASHLAKTLCPVELQDSSLDVALYGLAIYLREDLGIPCHFDFATPAPVVETAAATHLYRIAQEAVNNSLKHAQASHIWIRLTTEEGRSVLTVEDDGIGIPEEVDTAAGLGLRTMRHRATLIGGRLEVSRRAEGGTRVTCSVPEPTSGQLGGRDATDERGG